MKKKFSKILISLMTLCFVSQISFANDHSSFEYDNESPAVELHKYSLAFCLAGNAVSLLGVPGVGKALVYLVPFAGTYGYFKNLGKDHESIGSDMVRSAQVGRRISTVDFGIIGLLAGLSKRHYTESTLLTGLVGGGLGMLVGYVGHSVVFGLSGGIFSTIHKSNYPC